MTLESITEKIAVTNTANTYFFTNLLQANENFARALYMSVDFGEHYKNILDKSQGTLTTNYSNDTSNKFEAAFATLPMNLDQYFKLHNFYDAFVNVEKLVDPLRLNFKISVAVDNEVCITRSTQFSVNKIIIHDDGQIAFSSISRDKYGKDELTFFEEDHVNYEYLAFHFLSL